MADQPHVMKPFVDRPEKKAGERFSPEERYRVLTGVLESFVTALDPGEVLRRIVTVTREEFGADRAWLAHPISADAEFAQIRFVATTPEVLPDKSPIALRSVRALLNRASDSPRPIIVTEDDRDLDRELARRFAIRTGMLQILRPHGAEPWAFGVHQSRGPRAWTSDEVTLFNELGRYATIALTNTLLHHRAVREMSKVNAILDQIPEAAAIYDSSGDLDRMNAAAQKEPGVLFSADDTRGRSVRHRQADGSPVPPAEMPSMRALRGETVKSDYLIHDPRTGDERVVNLKAAPIRDDRERIIGSVVLSRDVTEDRQNAEREAWRRRRAEALANLGLEAITVQPAFDSLDEPARRLAEAIGGSAFIYLYHPPTSALHVVGFASVSEYADEFRKFRDFLTANPFHPGEGLPGTVFQIGRPLLFSEIRGDAVVDFARTPQEREYKKTLREQSLIVAPIESYGDRIGALVISRSDSRRNFDAEDLEFAQAAAERIGAAAHIHSLTRVSQEGHRAAEDLARREVDARVRFEAVIENAPIGIAVVSADELRFELANLRWMEFASLFGKIASDTKIIGLRVSEVLPGFEKVVKQVAETGESHSDEAIEVASLRGPMFVNRIISAVRGRFSGTTQSITILIQDVTEQVSEQRQNAEREARRRRRAEALAALGIESVAVQPSFENLDAPAKRIADAISGTATIYLYHQATGELHVAGMASVAPTAEWFEEYREYQNRNPLRAGDALPGTVFQIGRPLLFSDVKGEAVIEFGRNAEEKELLRHMNEQSLIACSIESYGDRIGALVISRSDERFNLAADDLEFAIAVAERIGGASHVHRLSRISLEGHRAAEELARREVDARVRFEAVLENAPVGIAVISADELRFELANLRWNDFAAMFGKISPDTKIVGLRVAEVIPGWERAITQVAESGETRMDEAVEIVGGPKPIYINRIISAVRGRFSGITQSITVLIQDVTEQVKSKREIEQLAKLMAERSARLDSILGSMTDGLWVYDANGRVDDVNQAGLTMFGLGSRKEAIEFGSFERLQLRYPDGRPISLEDLPWARALRGNTVPDYLAIARHVITGKDLDLSIALAPIESNGIVGAVLVIRDITALQELDRKKDEFLSVASHELRTPLTTIKGYTQLLVQTTEDAQVEERTTYLNAVLGEIERMMGLISELLDVSRIETNRLQIHPQVIRWIEFLQRRVSAFRVQHPSRPIKFEAEISETIVIADPDRMRQVVDNLLSNAIKYSPEGSDIEVRASIAHGRMVTEVIDFGIGIPRDEIPQLFERFHRARNVSSRYYGGLGLGLYIAKAIIEAHDGTIWVESVEGEGSTFTVTLPLP